MEKEKEKDRLDEHDITKNMLNIIRGFNNSKLITEEQHQQDTIIPRPGDAVWEDELKKLRLIDTRVKITNFKIYPSDDNVVIEGIFAYKESDDSGIHFKMSLAEDELDTTMDNVNLNDDISGVLNRLKGYYVNWKKEWAGKLPTEYKPKQD